MHLTVNFNDVVILSIRIQRHPAAIYLNAARKKLNDALIPTRQVAPYIVIKMSTFKIFLYSDK